MDEEAATEKAKVEAPLIKEAHEMLVKWENQLFVPNDAIHKRYRLGQEEPVRIAFFGEFRIKG